MMKRLLPLFAHSGRMVGFQLGDDFVAVFIKSDGADDQAFVAKLGGVIGEIGRCAAQLFSFPYGLTVFLKLVPKNFAQADYELRVFHGVNYSSGSTRRSLGQ